MTKEAAEEIQLLREEWDWEKFRREAAKAAMLGILAGRRSHQGFHETAEEAVSYADALIRQLKLK